MKRAKSSETFFDASEPVNSLFTGALVNAFRVVDEGGEWESSRGGVLRVGDYRPSLLWL